MAGIRLPPENSDVPQARAPAAVDLISDDDRSVAADSWSIKSDYGSTLDDDQRHADAAEALSAATFRAPSDYSSDKDEPDAEAVTSMLGFQSYWDATYADELVNFREHGHAGEVWFGAEVMETVATWAKSLCSNVCQGHLPNHADDSKSGSVEQCDKDLINWSVLDIGTGNGLLLQELAKQGFTDLTGTDYSEGAIDLARSLADRDGFTNIKFLILVMALLLMDSFMVKIMYATEQFGLTTLWRFMPSLDRQNETSTFYDDNSVDDVLETKIERAYQLVMDKGTLDAIGLHPDGPVKRIMYWDSVSRLVVPGGILVITSCNNTKDELVQEVENFNRRSVGTSQEARTLGDQDAVRDPPLFCYLDHVRSYPTFMFGGSVGSLVTTVAFMRYRPQ